MIVDLNTEAFSNAKDGDLFVVEVKEGKKYAKPIDKDEFLKTVENRLTSVELDNKNLQLSFNKLKDEVTDKAVKIAKLVGGKENENKL